MWRKRVVAWRMGATLGELPKLGTRWSTLVDSSFGATKCEHLDASAHFSTNLM